MRITAPMAIKTRLNAAAPSSLAPVVGRVLGVPMGVARGETAGATEVPVTVSVAVVGSVAAMVGTGVSMGAWLALKSPSPVGRAERPPSRS